MIGVLQCCLLFQKHALFLCLVWWVTLWYLVTNPSCTHRRGQAESADPQQCLLALDPPAYTAVHISLFYFSPPPSGSRLIRNDRWFFLIFLDFVLELFFFLFLSLFPKWVIPHPYETSANTVLLAGSMPFYQRGQWCWQTNGNVAHLSAPSSAKTPSLSVSLPPSWRWGCEFEPESLKPCLCGSLQSTQI